MTAPVRTTPKTIEWPSKSGTTYTYYIHPIGTIFQDKPGNYVFAKEISPDHWKPLYFGETEHLSDRLTSSHEKLPCVRRNGGTYVHVHKSSANASARRVEESDLINRWGQVC